MPHVSFKMETGFRPPSELRRHQTLQRAKRKLRALARVMKMYEAKKAQAAPELSVLDVVD